MMRRALVAGLTGIAGAAKAAPAGGVMRSLEAGPAPEPLGLPVYEIGWSDAVSPRDAAREWLAAMDRFAAILDAAPAGRCLPMAEFRAFMAQRSAAPSHPVPSLADECGELLTELERRLNARGLGALDP